MCWSPYLDRDMQYITVRISCGLESQNRASEYANSNQRAFLSPINFALNLGKRKRIACAESRSQSVGMKPKRNPNRTFTPLVIERIYAMRISEFRSAPFVYCTRVQSRVRQSVESSRVESVCDLCTVDFRVD